MDEPPGDGAAFAALVQAGIDAERAWHDMVALTEELGLYEDPAEVLEQDAGACE